jgi:hypothetical protein
MSPGRVKLKLVFAASPKSFTFVYIHDLKNQHTSPKVVILLSFLSYYSFYLRFVYNRSAILYTSILYAYYIISLTHAYTYCKWLYSGEDFISLENLLWTQQVDHFWNFWASCLKTGRIEIPKNPTEPLQDHYFKI